MTNKIMGNNQKQQGVALIIVLWISVLLAVISGSYVLLSRTEMLQARYLLDSTRALYFAEAGIHRAAYELRNPDIETRWEGNGRTYFMEFMDANIEIQIEDETGKIDLNSADEQLLNGLFSSINIEEQQALELVGAILDWRDPDDLLNLNGAEDSDYDSAGYSYGAKDAPFDTVEELQQVMGMSYEIYTQIEPALTVYSGRGQLNKALAPRQALAALPDMTPDILNDFVCARNNNLQGEPLPALPDGTIPVARGGGLTYSVRSRATLPNGAWNQLQVTIRLRGLPGQKPFTIMRWKEGVIDQAPISELNPDSCGR